MTISGIARLTRMDQVVFGRPAAEAVAAEVDRVGAHRAFLIVSGSLNRDTDVIEQVRTALGARCAGTFDAMPAHTPRGAVIAAAAAAREANADLLVTIGGGSVTDGTKVVQLCLANDIRTIEGLDGFTSRRGPDGSYMSPPGNPPAPRQITVPTTLSGGEFNPLAGCTDERRHVKQMYHHPMMVPRAVVLDPAVTVHTPMWLWLATGIRAVDHCVEGLCSQQANPYSDAAALHGLTLLSRGLPRVKADPNDLVARLDCQIGAWLSMTPGTSGVPMGASHGIGYVLGAAHDVPHGHTSCVMLPAVVRWNKGANHDRQALVSAAMGHAGEDAGDALDAFIRGLGMPRSLAEVGVGPEHFDRIAEQALKTQWVPLNPRPIDSPAQVREILELAA